jgi:hypothetical protein
MDEWLINYLIEKSEDGALRSTYQKQLMTSVDSESCELPPQGLRVTGPDSSLKGLYPA